MREIKELIHDEYLEAIQDQKFYTNDTRLNLKNELDRLLTMPDVATVKSVQEMEYDRDYAFVSFCDETVVHEYFHNIQYFGCIRSYKNIINMEFYSLIPHIDGVYVISYSTAWYHSNAWHKQLVLHGSEEMESLRRLGMKLIKVPEKTFVDVNVEIPDALKKLLFSDEVPKYNLSYTPDGQPDIRSEMTKVSGTIVYHKEDDCLSFESDSREIYVSGISLFKLLAKNSLLVNKQILNGAKITLYGLVHELEDRTFLFMGRNHRIRKLELLPEVISFNFDLILI